MLQEYCMTFLFRENGLDRGSILQMRLYSTDRLRIPKFISFHVWGPRLQITHTVQCKIMFKVSLTWATGQLHPHHTKQMGAHTRGDHQLHHRHNPGGACLGGCIKWLLAGTGQNATQLPRAGLNLAHPGENSPLPPTPWPYLVFSLLNSESKPAGSTRAPELQQNPSSSSSQLSCAHFLLLSLEGQQTLIPHLFLCDIHHFCRSPSRPRTPGGFLSRHTLDFSSFLQHCADWGRWNGRQGGPEPHMVLQTGEHHTFTQQHVHAFCFVLCSFTNMYWHLFCLAFCCHFYRTTTKSLPEQLMPGAALIRHALHCDCPPPPTRIAFVYLQAISSSILSSNHSVQGVLQHISASPSFRYS